MNTGTTRNNLLKDKVKWLLLGALLMALAISIIIPVLADAGMMTIDVWSGDVKVYIDGDLQTLTNVKGDIVQPMIYEGTTYLPILANTFEGDSISYSSSAAAILFFTHFLVVASVIFM